MIVIDQTSCIGCGKCVSDCVGKHLFLKDNKAVYKDSCIRCGHCVAICPKNAVTIPEYDMEEVEEYDKESFHMYPDHLLHAIKFRRSIRDFKSKTVPDAALHQIIQAGRYTATAVNSQNCRFIIVKNQLETYKNMIWDEINKESSDSNNTDPDRKQTLIDYHNFLFRNAPVVIYIAANHTIDAGLAAQNMELMAISLGLGVLYNGYLVRAANQSKEALKWLETGNKKIAACMLLGYPNVSYCRTAPRRKADIIEK